MQKREVRVAFSRMMFTAGSRVKQFIKKIMQMRAASVEKEDFIYEDFQDAERSAYHRFTLKAEDRSIDEQTWRDLMVEDLLRKCAQRSSIHGIQMMYFALRTGGARLSFERWAQWSALEERLRSPLNGLKTARLEVATALCGPPVNLLPSWAPRIYMIPWVEGAVFLFLTYLQWWPAVFAALAVFFIVHGSIQINLYPHLMAWRGLRRELVLLLDVAAELRALNVGDSPMACFDHLKRAPIDSIRRDIAPSIWEAVPAFAEYGDLFFLHSCAGLDDARTRLASHRAELLSIFECLAKVEMYCCVARFRGSYAMTSDVRRPTDTRFSLSDAENPLVPGGMRFSIAMKLNGAVITGKNGVGKSTLLRGIGLNLVLGRAFGFCIASAAEVPDLMPWSSIQNEDSLALGESLYMAEMRRANELIAASETGGCAFLVDELFRGTNNVESVGAATAVLEQLAIGDVVIATSHNTILASTLATSFTALALRRRSGHADRDTLELAHGVERETNGIAMMSRFSLPEKVVSRANFIANWYLQDVLKPGDAQSRKAAA